MRTERDFLGEKELAADCLYGIETLRAQENFPVSGKPVRQELILALVGVKKAAAMANKATGLLEAQKADAIVAACEALLAGQHADAFVTDALQGGAGTSTNMNVNEVIANAALKILGKPAGAYEMISPLDDVNKGQSTNDVYPTALRIAAVRGVRALSEECARLQESLQKKEQQFANVVKLGRTEMMDAVAVTLGQEFGAYAQAIARDRWRIYKSEERLRLVNIGGTAVGTGSNAHRKYVFKITELLQEQTGIGLARAEYPMDITQNNDVFAEVSGFLKALAVNLMKISGDLRLMASGPDGGLGEIRLAPLQAGSTIMPGKVNPVIPEMTIQAAIRVIANDTAITTAAAMGNLELNAFLPLIADCLLESLQLLTNTVRIFREKCVDLLEADAKRCAHHLSRSATAYATALAPYTGYAQAAELIQICGADRKKIIQEVLRRNLMSPEQLDTILTFSQTATYLD